MPDNTFMEAVQVGSNLMARRQQMQSQQLQDALAVQAAQRQAELMPFQIKNQQLQQEIQTANLLDMTMKRERFAKITTGEATLSSVMAKWANDYSNPEFITEVAKVGASTPELVDSDAYKSAFELHNKAKQAKQTIAENEASRRASMAREKVQGLFGLAKEGLREIGDMAKTASTTQASITAAERKAARDKYMNGMEIIRSKQVAASKLMDKTSRMAAERAIREETSTLEERYNQELKAIESGGKIDTSSPTSPGKALQVGKYKVIQK